MASEQKKEEVVEPTYEESECMPLEIKIDLEEKAEVLGIKTFFVVVSSLSFDQRVMIVPKSAIRRTQKQGVNYHGYFDFGAGGSEPELYFVPDPTSLIQLPWKPDMAWVSSFVYQNGKPYPQCPRRCLMRQIEKAAKLGYVLKTGIEPEFILLKKGTSELCDELDVTCGHTRAMMRSSPFLLKLSESLDTLNWGVYKFKKQKVKIEHEGAYCQYEVSFGYSDALTTSDRWLFIKFMVQDIAEEAGLRATFMPTIMEGMENFGNGMHIHHSLWDLSEKNQLFPQQDGKHGFSDIGRQFLAGELKHAKNSCAIFLSTVNSYKRFKLPNFLNVVAYGVDNRWPTHRIVTECGRSNRVEFRSGDAAGNPYLVHAALLAAGLDGIENKLELDDKMKVEGELFLQPPAEEMGLTLLPGNLGEAIGLIEKNEFLKEKLGEKIIMSFIKKKQEAWKDFNKHISEWEKKYIDSY